MGRLIYLEKIQDGKRLVRQAESWESPAGLSVYYVYQEAGEISRVTRVSYGTLRSTDAIREIKIIPAAFLETESSRDKNLAAILSDIEQKGLNAKIIDFSKKDSNEPPSKIAG